MQNMALRIITELHPFEANRSARAGDLHRVRRIGDIVLAVENFEAAAGAGGSAFHRPRGVGERLERLV